MTLIQKTKQEVIKEFAKSSSDVGSSEVQIAILTRKLSILTEHMKKNKRDKATEFGLKQVVNHRAKLLKYLKRTKPDVYFDLIKKLSIRK